MVAQDPGIAQYLQRRAPWEPRFIPIVGLECAFGPVPSPLIVYLTLSMNFNYLLITSLTLPKLHNTHATLMPESCLLHKHHLQRIQRDTAGLSFLCVSVIAEWKMCLVHCFDLRRNLLDRSGKTKISLQNCSILNKNKLSGITIIVKSFMW